jgi:predicted metal-dependent phosphoesterase TrpH
MQKPTTFNTYGIHYNNETVRVGPHALVAMYTYTEDGTKARLRAISKKHGAIYVTLEGEIIKRPLLSENEESFLQSVLQIENNRHHTHKKIQATLAV